MAHFRAPHHHSLGLNIYFQRDPKTKEPTGWVVETPAEQRIQAKLDPPTPEAQNAATAELLPKLAAAGITAAFDARIATMRARRRGSRWHAGSGCLWGW